MTALTEQQEFRALVVDDDAVVRRMVSFALKQEGFSCDSAIDGEQALALLNDRQYDLVVTDLLMPNKHGHALAVDVLAGASRPKIIVHTSVDEPRLTKDLIVRGVDDVVYKPANYVAFAAKARGLVSRDRNQQEQQSPAIPQESTTKVSQKSEAIDADRQLLLSELNREEASQPVETDDALVSDEQATDETQRVEIHLTKIEQRRKETGLAIEQLKEGIDIDSGRQLEELKTAVEHLAVIRFRVGGLFWVMVMIVLLVLWVLSLGQM